MQNTFLQYSANKVEMTEILHPVQNNEINMTGTFKNAADDQIIAESYLVYALIFCPITELQFSNFSQIY